MTRSYGAVVFVENYEPGNENVIKLAVEDSWDLECPVESWSDRGGRVLEAYGSCALYANDRPIDFASRLAESVWKANDGYCDVGVVLVPRGLQVEDNRSYRTTPADYRRWLLTGELPCLGDSSKDTSLLMRAA